MHYFDHTIDNRIQYLYFMRSLLLLKSPILAKSWCASLLHMYLELRIDLRIILITGYVHIYTCEVRWKIKVIFHIKIPE